MDFRIEARMFQPGEFIRVYHDPGDLAWTATADEIAEARQRCVEIAVQLRAATKAARARAAAREMMRIAMRRLGIPPWEKIRIHTAELGGSGDIAVIE